MAQYPLNFRTDTKITKTFIAYISSKTETEYMVIIFINFEANLNISFNKEI